MKKILKIPIIAIIIVCFMTNCVFAEFSLRKAVKKVIGIPVELVCGALAGYFCGVFFLNASQQTGDICHIMYFVGTAFTSALAVYVSGGATETVGSIGTTTAETGSFKAALIGSSIPAAISMVFALTQIPGGLGEEYMVLTLVTPFFSSIGATIGYNVTMKQKKSALINIEKESVNISFPQIYLTKTQHNTKGLTLNARLLEVKF